MENFASTNAQCKMNFHNMAQIPMTPENIAQVQVPATIEEIKRIREENQIRPELSAHLRPMLLQAGQFLPIAGMSIISPSVAPAGLAFLATVSGGDKYQRAKEAGFGEGEALAQGIAYGAAEAIGEKIGLDYLLAAAKNPAVMSGVRTIFAQGLKQAGVEGAEEGLTQIIQNATDIVAKKVNPNTTGEAPSILQDVPYAMGVGAAAGGVTGGGLGALQSMMGGQQQAPPQQEQVSPPPPESPTATEPPPQKMEETAKQIIIPQEPDARLDRTQPQFEREARPEMQPPTIDQLFKRESTTPQPKKEYGYLMNARPFSIGAQPKGQVRVNERTDGRYGTIYYDRPLTEQEMKSYELKPEGPIVYKDVTDNPFYNDIKDLKVIDTDKSADNILELTGSDKPIFLRNGKERIAVITPSAKQKGKFQATKFDERGPIGDAVSSTPKEAIKSLIEDGYKELSNEQEFTELTFDTKETQRQEVIRNINKPSTPSPQPQQAAEVAPEGISTQPALETPIKPLEVIEKEIEDLKFKLNRNRNISAKQLMEAKTNIGIFQDDIGDALRKNKDTSFASKQWEEIKSKYSPEILEEAEKQKFAVKQEEKMAINRKLAAEYQKKIDEAKLQPASKPSLKD